MIHNSLSLSLSAGGVETYNSTTAPNYFTSNVSGTGVTGLTKNWGQLVYLNSYDVKEFLLSFWHRTTQYNQMTYVTTSDFSFNEILAGNENIEVKIDKDSYGRVSLFARIPESSSLTNTIFTDFTYGAIFNCTFLPLN